MQDGKNTRGADVGGILHSAPVRIALAAASALALAGCLATTPTMGGAGTVASGSAGGASTQGENSALEKCDQTLGTLGIDEDQSSPWYGYYSQQYKLGSTVPLLRLIIQQSNCFVIVERGASFNNVMRERQIRDSGEMRAGSNMQQGQLVAADYTMRPSITFSEQGTGGVGAAIGGRLGIVGALVGGSMRQNEASTTLLLVDNRSGVQLAAAEGSAKNMDFGLLGGLFGGSGGGVGGAYSRTPEGKVLVAAFVDSYNQMVKAVKNYKAQTVRGGLGTGGSLGVQGGQTPASQAPAPAAKPQAAPAAKPSPTPSKQQPAKKN